MPLDKHNSTTDMATDFISSLVNIALSLFANCSNFCACIIELNGPHLLLHHGEGENLFCACHMASVGIALLADTLPTLFFILECYWFTDDEAWSHLLFYSSIVKAHASISAFAEMTGLLVEVIPMLFFSLCDELNMKHTGFSVFH